MAYGSMSRRVIDNSNKGLTGIVIQEPVEMQELWCSLHPVANSIFEGVDCVCVCVCVCANTISDRKLNPFTAMISLENDP